MSPAGVLLESCWSPARILLDVILLQSSLSPSPVRPQSVHSILHPCGLHEEGRGSVRYTTSPAFVDAHQQLQDSPKEPGCDLPRVVIALMFWSDSTHLASFSNAKIWPLYLFCGNESKYQCCKPSCNLCSHIAYFHKV